MQTYFVSKIMLQNLAVILQQLHYGKISFIVLATDDARADQEA